MQFFQKKGQSSLTGHWTAEVIARGRANIENELASFVARPEDRKLARTSALVCLFVFWNNRIDGHGTAKLAATISIVNDIFESGLPIENDPSWSKERRECANQVRAWQHWKSNSFFVRSRIDLSCSLAWLATLATLT